MMVKVKYLEKNLNENLEICFSDFNWFGVWIANNYKDIEIVEIVQEE